MLETDRYFLNDSSKDIMKKFLLELTLKQQDLKQEL